MGSPKKTIPTVIDYSSTVQVPKRFWFLCRLNGLNGLWVEILWWWWQWWRQWWWQWWQLSSLSVHDLPVRHALSWGASDVQGRETYRLCVRACVFAFLFACKFECHLEC